MALVIKLITKDCYISHWDLFIIIHLYSYRPLNVFKYTYITIKQTSATSEQKKNLTKCCWIKQKLWRDKSPTLWNDKVCTDNLGGVEWWGVGGAVFKPTNCCRAHNHFVFIPTRYLSRLLQLVKTSASVYIGVI